MDKVVLESAGVSVVGVSAFLLTKYLTIGKIFDSNDNKIAASSNADGNSGYSNSFYFTVIPIIVYLAFRVYFGVTLFFSEKINSKILPIRFQNSGNHIYIFFQSLIKHFFFYFDNNYYY